MTLMIYQDSNDISYDQWIGDSSFVFQQFLCESLNLTFQFRFHNHRVPTGMLLCTLLGNVITQISIIHHITSMTIGYLSDRDGLDVLDKDDVLQTPFLLISLLKQHLFDGCHLPLAFYEGKKIKIKRGKKNQLN